MSGTVVYVILFFAVSYGVIFYLAAQRKKKMQGAMDNLNMRSEESKAPIYMQELLDKKYSFLKQQLKDAPVDAFTIANLEYTAGNQAKDVAKDALKSLATLGTVKFTTVQTPKYLILSGNDLHMLDTDTDGEIKKHLIFDKYRLQNASIQELPVSKAENAQAKFLGLMPKRYRFSLPTDDSKIDLIVFDSVISTAAESAGSAFSAKTDEQVQRYVVGNYFLKKLGENIPSLKIATAFTA